MYHKYFHCNLCRCLYLISAYILFHTFYKYLRVYDTPVPVLGLLGQAFLKRLWSGREGGERCTCWWPLRTMQPLGRCDQRRGRRGVRSLQAAVLVSTLCPWPILRWSHKDLESGQAPKEGTGFTHTWRGSKKSEQLTYPWRGGKCRGPAPAGPGTPKGWVVSVRKKTDRHTHTQTVA